MILCCRSVGPSVRIFPSHCSHFTVFEKFFGRRNETEFRQAISPCVGISLSGNLLIGGTSPCVGIPFTGISFTEAQVPVWAFPSRESPLRRQSPCVGIPLSGSQRPCVGTSRLRQISQRERKGREDGSIQDHNQSFTVSD